MVFLCNYASTATVFNFQKTFIAVGHAVGTANRIVVGWTDLLAATEQETLHAPLHGHHVHVFPAIVPLHFAFVTIKLVVGTTNKLPLSTTDLVAERSSATMLCWNLNYPLTACLTLQMAKGSVNVAIASTNWFLRYLAAIFGALFGLLQGRALSDVSQLNTL